MWGIPYCNDCSWVCPPRERISYVEEVLSGKGDGGLDSQAGSKKRDIFVVTSVSLRLQTLDMENSPKKTFNREKKDLCWAHMSSERFYHCY